MTKAFAITPVHDLLLRGSQDMPIGLYHLHLATAEQLTRLHYKPGMLKTVQKRLKTLTTFDFIQADWKPSKRMKEPLYYALGEKAIRYLKDIGMDVDSSLRGVREDREHYLFIDHALDLTDILIAALKLKQVHPSYYLSRFVHERTLKRTPYKMTLNGHNIGLIPDGFLDFHQRRAEQPEPSLPLILEHDRGTEQQQHFRRRIQAYRAFLQAGGQTQMFGAVKSTVVFTTFISPNTTVTVTRIKRTKRTLLRREAGPGGCVPRCPLCTSEGLGWTPWTTIRSAPAIRAKKTLCARSRACPPRSGDDRSPDAPSGASAGGAGDKAAPTGRR